MQGTPPLQLPDIYPTLWKNNSFLAFFVTMWKQVHDKHFFETILLGKAGDG